MRRIETSVEIHAPLDLVWAVLVDFERYSEWNPFIVDASGDLIPGDPLALTIKPEGGRAMNIAPRLLTLDVERELRWRGKILLPGVFAGEHVFRLSEKPGLVRLDHFEIFTGILVPVLWRILERPTRGGFEAMNRALKNRAEALARKRGLAA